MSHAALTDGYTANGVFLASLDPFATESDTHRSGSRLLDTCTAPAHDADGVLFPAADG